MVKTYTGDKMEYDAEPNTEPKYKCNDCLLILEKKDLIGGACPECGKKPELACECDRECHCACDHNSGIRYCIKCGKPVCPCGSSDVVCVTRITGYLQDLSGFNSGKAQEVKDRVRHDPLTGRMTSRGAFDIGGVAP
jgi:Anaerobic ribonucleoside-triphosphate reductase